MNVIDFCKKKKLRLMGHGAIKNQALKYTVAVHTAETKSELREIHNKWRDFRIEVQRRLDCGDFDVYIDALHGQFPWTTRLPD